MFSFGWDVGYSQGNLIYRQWAIGRCYVHRATLFVDGKEFAAQDGDKIFKFTVPISGTHEIKAVAVAMIQQLNAALNKIKK